MTDQLFYNLFPQLLKMKLLFDSISCLGNDRNLISKKEGLASIAWLS